MNLGHLQFCRPVGAGIIIIAFGYVIVFLVGCKIVQGRSMELGLFSVFESILIKYGVRVGCWA